MTDRTADVVSPKLSVAERYRGEQQLGNIGGEIDQLLVLIGTIISRKRLGTVRWTFTDFFDVEKALTSQSRHHPVLDTKALIYGDGCGGHGLRSLLPSFAPQMCWRRYSVRLQQKRGLGDVLMCSSHISTQK